MRNIYLFSLALAQETQQIENKTCLNQSLFSLLANHPLPCSSSQHCITFASLRKKRWCFMLHLKHLTLFCDKTTTCPLRSVLISQQFC